MPEQKTVVLDGEMGKFLRGNGNPSPVPDPNFGRGKQGWDAQKVEEAHRLFSEDHPKAENQVEGFHNGTVLRNQ